MQTYSADSRLANDPLQFARRHLEEGRPKAEIEAIALYSAMLSYGKVDLFLAVIRQTLDLAHDRFLDFVTAHPFSQHQVSQISPGRSRTQEPAGLVESDRQSIAQTVSTPAGFPRYRLSTADEIWHFARAIGWVVRVDGGLFPSFYAGFVPQRSLREGLVSLRNRLLDGLHAHHVDLSPGLAHLLPDPALGGACKRWLMFLRWVVRPDDGLDLGLWREIPAAVLLIPIDRHVSAIARALGLTQRKTDDWKTAEEITTALRRFAPDDPVRYDFALAHLGISGECTHGRDPAACRTCRLRTLCTHGTMR
ncbi:MAG TPA: TIGR02757 family protein [Candidatus Ozemobacteraceae bacterium]|nr:TIGR02757 family protein [Candidatus Ozemobacteraceae bacterium]